MSPNTLTILVVVACFSMSAANIFKFRRPVLMGDKVPTYSLLPNRKQIQHKLVKYHNYFRTIVQPPAANMLKMKWHKGAAHAAQRWADECMFLTHDNQTGRHDHNYGACGQNIFVSTHQVPWMFALKTWFSEKDNFTYGGEDNNLKVVGHYTQMVWAASHEVGCGFAKCYKNSLFSKKMYYNYVCNYCPIGNRPTHLGYPYKHGKPCHQCKDKCVRKKLCTNGCHFADHWTNCQDLHKMWPDWLCKTGGKKGNERTNNCRATCFCKDKIYD